MPEPIEISVVLPLYRTASAVVDLYGRLTSALSPITPHYELVFIDDACPENTAALLEPIAKADPHVVVCRNPQNLGQQRTVHRGLAMTRGRRIVIMDADLQDPPEQIPALLDDLARGGAEAVFAGRRGRYQASSRLATSRIFKSLMHRISGVPPDAGSFVVMTRRMAGAVLTLHAEFPYMLALIGATGLPVRSIALPRSTRQEGKSAYSEWGRLRFALTGLLAALELRWNRKHN